MKCYNNVLFLNVKQMRKETDRKNNTKSFKVFLEIFLVFWSRSNVSIFKIYDCKAILRYVAVHVIISIQYNVICGFHHHSVWSGPLRWDPVIDTIVCFFVSLFTYLVKWFGWESVEFSHLLWELFRLNEVIYIRNNRPCRNKILTSLRF